MRLTAIAPKGLVSPRVNSKQKGSSLTAIEISLIHWISYSYITCEMFTGDPLGSALPRQARAQTSGRHMYIG